MTNEQDWAWRTNIDATDLSDVFVQSLVQNLSWNSSGTGERRKREMIPSTAVLEVDREVAETQLALYADLPQLTPREKNLLAIYDAVIAGEKVIHLSEVLKRGEAYALRGFPKVAIAPVTAERVTFQRKVTSTYPWSDSGKYSASYRAGSWSQTIQNGRWSRWSNRLSSAQAEALTPLVPPSERDKVQDGDLFLWEPTWLRKEESVIQYDPAVIRPLSNGLYKVVLAWDLTAAEAMMLGGE